MKDGIEWTNELIEAALREEGRFENLTLLGRGSFGCVCHARKLETGEDAAIKFVPRSEVNKYVETEIVNHSLMHHPHIIQFRDVFLTSKFICIVMEYAGTGTLHSYVRKFGHLKESVARWFFQQLALAVDFCHKKGVANRDIKLENTLLHGVPHLPLPLLKMCDFGYSKEEARSAAKSKVGTLTYMAPEVLLNITGQTRYDGKVADIWSCGVMLYVMLTGRYPFGGPNNKGVITTPQDFIAMLEQMVGCQYEIPDSFGLSEDCKDLMRRMLMPEPHKRISTEDILAHRWFNTNLPPEAATMNDRCLQLGQLAGVPDPDTIRQIVCTATSGGSSSFAGTSSHAAASAGGGGPSKGSGYSSGTQMHGTSGHQQQQQASACVPAVQQLTQQQLQQQQQQLAQMSWAQQQQAGAGAYALQHDTQQHVQPQAQPQQGQQQYYQQYM